MHELGIVFHALDRVQKLAEENELTKIASVTMEFGEVSGVVTQEMVRCWNWAVTKRPPVLQEAELKIEEIPAKDHTWGPWQVANTYTKDGVKYVVNIRICDVCGAKEEELGAVGVRGRKQGEMGAIELDKFIADLKEEIAERRL